MKQTLQTIKKYYAWEVIGSSLAILAYALSPSALGLNTVTASVVSATPAIPQQFVIAPRVHSSPVAAKMPTTIVERTAKRLHGRLLNRGMKVPSLSALEGAVKERGELLRKSVAVQFTTSTGAEVTVWNASTQAYPLWIQPEFTASAASFSLSDDDVKSVIRSKSIQYIPYPIDIVLTELKDEGGVHRAATTGVAKAGYDYDAEAVADSVLVALKENEPNVLVPMEYRQGSIVNQTSTNFGDLKLISTGLSNFKGSGYGRIGNVRKGLNEHLNNVVIMPGEEFSFNKAMGPSITTGNGWFMALIIENGADLVPAPGGGICQVSTTFFRALTYAGLPVHKRKSHSLYVTYYTPHGVGLDATVMAPVQDLTFTNDTAAPLLVQAYDDGFDAYVNVYGTPDGRTVNLAGPYFSNNTPEGMHGAAPLEVRHNEILWLSTVTYPNGEVRDESIYSRYRSIPKSVRTQFTPMEAYGG